MAEEPDEREADDEPTDGLTRRTLLGGAPALGAAAAIPAAAKARRRHRRRKRHKRKHRRSVGAAQPAAPVQAAPVDVVVVGAGLAGLVAARQIVRAGRSAILLE